MRLHAVTVVVDDYDVAIAHYVGDLGFHLMEDTDLGGGKRWVRVAPDPSSGSGLILATATTASQRAAIGNQAGGRVGFFVHTDDFAGEHARLVARGVRMTEAPRTEPYGTVVVFEDRYGNRWDLIQPVGVEAPADFVVAAVVLRDVDGRVLLVRKRGTSRFMLPGGKIEPGETPADAAVRELHEEVGADLELASLTFLGEWTAPAANEPDHVVRGHIFEHPWVPGLVVRAEIEELIWLHPAQMVDRGDLAPLLVTRVLPEL